MRRRHDLVCELDDRCIVEHPLAYPDALRMFEVMWQEGVDVGISPATRGPASRRTSDSPVS